MVGALFGLVLLVVVVLECVEPNEVERVRKLCGESEELVEVMEMLEAASCKESGSPFKNSHAVFIVVTTKLLQVD